MSFWQSANIKEAVWQVIKAIRKGRWEIKLFAIHHPYLAGDAEAVENIETDNKKASDVKRGKMCCITFYQPDVEVLSTIKFWFDHHALYLGRRSIVSAMHDPFDPYIVHSVIEFIELIVCLSLKSVMLKLESLF